MVPFVAPLLPINQQDVPGLWPAYVTGLILASPFIIAALGIKLLEISRKFTLDRYGISYSSAFRQIRIDWNEVDSMRESTSQILSFEFYTKGRIVKIPISGIAAKDELRALVRKRIPQMPNETRKPSYQPRKVWCILLLLFTVSVMLGAFSDWLLDIFSPPFSRIQLRVLSSISHWFPWLLLALYKESLQPFISSLELTGEQLVYREFPRKRINIPYGQITKLEIKETNEGFLNELVVHYNNKNLALSRGHLNLLAIADQLSQKSGRSIQYLATDAKEAAAR